MLYAIKLRYRQYGRFYHNLEHISAMSEQDDDLSLTQAIDYHDVVYDTRGNNEERSADMFLGSGRYSAPQLSEEERESVYDAILMTKDHLVSDNEIGNELIRRDLKGLTNLNDLVKNWYLIREEARVLLSIEHKDFYKGNIAFMEGLMGRMDQNIQKTQDIFWSQVSIGCRMTINRSIEAYNKKEF